MRLGIPGDDAAVAEGRRDPRETCYRCFRPAESCLCPALPPMETRTRFILLMHPMEYKRIRCNTGRLTCLNLANCEMIPGIAFDGEPRVRALLSDPASFPVLLFPGQGAVNVTREGLGCLRPGDRRLAVILLDGTWSSVNKMFRLSPCLHALPRLMFTPSAPSRYYIKRQPRRHCLSTLEAVHELLLALERAGRDDYPDKERLLAVFAAMQEYQAVRAAAEGRVLKALRGKEG